MELWQPHLLWALSAHLFSWVRDSLFCVSVHRILSVSNWSRTTGQKAYVSGMSATTAAGVKSNEVPATGMGPRVRVPMYPWCQEL